MAAIASMAAGVSAQTATIFSENFNNSGATPPQNPYPPGPPLLAQRGWIFRNQCQPIGTINWLDSWSFSGSSASDYEGSFLRTHLWNIALNSTGTQSMWAILPDVPALSAGDTMRFVLRTFGPNQHVEVRLSPTGGTSTGSGPTAVGDFTTLVSDQVVPNNVWNQVSVVVPAGGRLAIRHFATQAGPTGPNAGAVWIDAMEITDAPPVRLQESFNNNGPVNPGTFGPSNLISRGWFFRDQSSPLGPFPGWLDGTQWNTPGRSGSCIWASVHNVLNNGIISDWAVLPSAPGQQAGDTLRFWVFNGASGRPDGFQVRYSPTGGTSTGTSATDVGDFTLMLLDQPFPWSLEWRSFDIPLPGAGRIAIRRYVNPGGLQTPNGGPLRIDDLSIEGTAPSNEITWTAAASPHVITGTRLIDADTILHIEAGATVHLNPGATLRIEGRADALGTVANPVMFTGTAPYPDAPRVVIAGGGLLELDHADVQCWVEPLVGDIFGTALAGDLTARHTRFHGTGQIVTIGYPAGQPSVLVIEDCSFESQTAFWHQACQARLRNLTFVTPGTFPGDAAVLWGHMNVDNITSNGVTLWFGDNKYGGQAQYLNNLSVTNLPQSAGLLLDARNYLLGPSVNATNCDVPVEFGASGATGLLPGSHVPATGNINNIVLDTSRNGANPTAVMGAIWAPVGVPYVIPGGTQLTTGDIDILPGTWIVLGQDVQWEWFGWFNAEGTAAQPIVFENSSPGFRWQRMLARTHLARLDHCEIRGGGFGIETFGGNARVSNMLIEDCTTALRASDGTFWEVAKSRLHNNLSGLYGAIWADGGNTPNSIVGNSEFGALNGATNSARVRGNWWGSSTGPTTPANPGGTGDIVFGNVLFQPFLTSAPDFSNQTPTVRIVDTHHRVFEPGSKVIIHWSATDDGSITEQRVLFSPTDFGGTHQLLATLPAGQRSYEWTVPNLAASGDTIESFRVEAVDNTGQVGWDEQVCAIPWDQSAGTLTPTTPFNAVHEFGDMFATTWDHSGWPVADLPAVYGRIMFENDFTWQDLGGNHASQGVLSGNQFMGNVSTDFARVHLKSNRSQFQVRHFFSQPFAIRPDPRMGDAAPTITLTTPGDGGSFAGGTVVPLTWTAGDDEGVRSFDIIASYDGGKWYYPIVKDLPGTALAYNWQLPPSTGIPDVRVRVIARDQRFQNTSDEIVVSITPGDGACPADFNRDGTVDFFDYDDFVACFEGAACPPGSGGADFNNDGSVDFFDYDDFVAAFEAGC